MFKLFIISVLSSIMLFTSNPCIANSFYYGADLGLQHIEFKPGYGDNLFPTDLPIGNLFIGFKFNDYFGIEGGYQSTVEQERFTTVFAGNKVLGNVIPSNINNVRQSSKLEVSGWYIGLTGYHNIFSMDNNNSLSVTGYVGIKQAQVNLERNIFSVTQAHALPESYSEKFVLNRGNDKAIAQLSIGLEYFFSKHFGLRTMVCWENTSKMRPTNVIGDYQAKLKDSISYVVGIIFK